MITPPKYLPRYLYHYTRLRGGSDDSERKYLEQLLLENNIWFSCPLKFNDPFDCKIPVYLKGTEKDKIQFMEELLRENYGRRDRRWRAKRIVKEKGFDTISTMVLKNMMSDISVLCLSATCSDILMFSHYTDGHRGFCLQFEVRKDPSLSIAKKVSYGKSNRYPRLNRLTDSSEKLFKGVLLVKSREWKYEQEYRVLIDKEAGYRRFESASLTGIILGCEMIDRHKRLILECLEKRKDHVDIYRASRNPHFFKLDFKPFEPEQAVTSN